MCCSASEMSGRKHLLLFTVSVLLETCQPKPQVTMSPQMDEIFSGDLFYLSCTGYSGSGVKWYFDSTEKLGVSETWKIAVASSKNSGSYQCGSDVEKSDFFKITVLDFAPRGSLTIKTGHPVMQYGHSAVLQLQNDDGLKGWMCHVYRTGKKEKKKVKLRLENNNTVVFQTTQLSDPETIYWCTDQEPRTRSNQIILRASAKDISLEMYPQPPAVGEKLTLRCLVWGTDKITETVFYKDDEVINRGPSSTYEIPEVKETTKGNYKCDATYTHVGRTQGPPYKRVSDVQELLVQALPIKAHLSEDKGSMLCSCSMPKCQNNTHCHWYYNPNPNPSPNEDSWEHLKDWKSCDMTAEKTGGYTCRAMWTNKRSELSNVHFISGPPSSPGLIVTIILLLVLAALICFAIAFYKYKKRSSQNQIYEDMPMREREYDVLQKGSDARREGEYDTLHPQAPDKVKTTGEYEALKKEEAKVEVYHTLGGEGGAAGGEGGYEALKKEGMKEGVYHTLKAEVAAAGGGDGGYEALKKEGMKEGVYHTLKAEGAAAEGGEGGYEALKKEGMKEGVYHTLGGEQKEEGKAGEQ